MQRGSKRLERDTRVGKRGNERERESERESERVSEEIFFLNNQSHALLHARCEGSSELRKRILLQAPIFLAVDHIMPEPDQLLALSTENGCEGTGRARCSARRCITTLQQHTRINLCLPRPLHY